MRSLQRIRSKQISLLISATAELSLLQLRFTTGLSWKVMNLRKLSLNTPLYLSVKL